MRNLQLIMNQRQYDDMQITFSFIARETKPQKFQSNTELIGLNQEFSLQKKCWIWMSKTLQFEHENSIPYLQWAISGK